MPPTTRVMSGKSPAGSNHGTGEPSRKTAMVISCATTATRPSTAYPPRTVNIVFSDDLKQRMMKEVQHAVIGSAPGAGDGTLSINGIPCHLGYVKDITDAPTLLSLPPEIRIIIYRFVLVAEEQPVRVTSTTRTPSLLHTCKLLRNESISIHFTENKFKFRIRDFDGSLYFKWWRVNRDWLKSKSCFNVRTAYDWVNLLQWAEFQFHEWCGGPDGSSQTQGRILGTMLRLVRQLRAGGNSWDEARQALELVHTVLAAQDARWPGE